MVNGSSEEKQNWKNRLRSFSDEVFRNYQIVRIRWEISSLERQRNQGIRDLGNRVFRLLKKNQIQIPELELLFKSIDEVESQIQTQEEKLREVIMKSDVPKQIPEELKKTPSETIPTPIQIPEPKPTPEPVKPKPSERDEIEKAVETAILKEIALDEKPKPKEKKKPEKSEPK